MEEYCENCGALLKENSKFSMTVAVKSKEPPKLVKIPITNVS